MDLYQSFGVFVRVAEKLSFSQAAEALGLPNASVSTIIQELESRLGVRLLERTTRRVSLTPDGANFLEKCRQLLADVEEAQAMFRAEPARIKGKVRVEMSAGMAGLIVPRLPEFFAAYPAIELELSSRDYLVDLLREGIDCAVRSGGPTETELMEKEIARMPVVNCVTPAYVAQFGKPRNLDDLANHRLIQYTHAFGSKQQGFEYFDGEKRRQIKMKTALTVNTGRSYGEACLGGLGIAQLPLIGVRSQLQDGSLLEVLPRYRPQPYPIKLVYQERRLLIPRARACMDWLEKTLSECLK